MKRSVKILLDALFAGIFIGIAGTVYLCTKNPVTGSFLFGFGLLTIVCFQLKLFTGAIGYLVEQGKNFPNYLLDLVLIWLGNLAGCAAVGYAVRATRTFAGIEEKVLKIVSVKVADDPVSLFILAIFCGMLMFTAVDAFKNDKLPAVCRPVMVFLCVMVFILSGFEHCIANMYYFSVAGKWSAAAMMNILLMTAGNSVGGFLLPLLADVKKP